MAEGLPGFASAAVSTVDGFPGPRLPTETVVTVSVADDPAAAERRLRKEYGEGLVEVTSVLQPVA